MHGASFLNRALRCTLHCNHRSGHLKTEHTSCKLAPWPRSKHEKRTAGSAREIWTVAAADGVRCARVRWEINFLLTFETAPFFCVYPVFPLCGFVLMKHKLWLNMFWDVTLCGWLNGSGVSGDHVAFLFKGGR